MTIEIKIDSINIFGPEDEGADEIDDLGDIKRSLAYLTRLVGEVLQATVTDPAKLSEITERVKASTDDLQAAVQGNTPPSTN